MIIVDPVIAALDLLIVDAETKYHQAMTGRLAVKVNVDGQETEFNKVSAPALAGYIALLRARREGFLLGTPTTGAIGFVF